MPSPSASAWEALRALPAYAVHEVPRPPADSSDRGATIDRHRRQRLAALVAAYHGAPGPVLVGWRRAAAFRPVEVYVAGDGLLRARGDGAAEAALSLPAGARANRLNERTLAALYADLPAWCAVTAITDGTLVDPNAEQTRPDELRPSLEDGLLAVWPEAFGWFVLAEPIGPAERTDLVARAADEQRQAKARSGASPDYAVRADRLERRHRELAQAATTGLWRIRLVAGGASPRAAAQVAALVAASADLTALPYALAPTETVGDLATVLEATGGGTDFVASSALLAAIATPPVAEVPGLRFRLRPDFDVTAEPSTADDATALTVGEILDRNRLPAGRLRLPRASLNRHTFVCGATGSGKSQTVRALLEAATAQGLPWLVIEPAKAEYRRMAARLADIGADVVVVRPGDVDGVPAGLNPLEPAIAPDGRRYPLQTHLDLVRSLFLAAFSAEEPFPQVLAAALTRCYEGLGWDLVLGEPANSDSRPRYPTLGDLEQAAERIVDEIGYSKEITDNVRGFIRVRLASLRLGTTGRFFEGGHPIDVERLLRRNVVLEIEDVGDDRDKAFLIGTVLIRLTEHLRLRQREVAGSAVPLRHLTVVEEAHRLLRNEPDGPGAHAVEMFAGLLAEIRAYGEGLVVAEQIPAKILPDVIKNTAVKIVHRLPARDDREVVGATMNITEAQTEYVATLLPGQAAVFTDGMDYPLLVAMPDGTERESSGAGRIIAAGELAMPRETSCGPTCRVRLCTLREIRLARQVLRAEPRLVLWAELAVLAHLTGWPMPVPDDPLCERMFGYDRRILDCALSHAVDDAVATRSRALLTGAGPHRLAAHVSDSVRDFVTFGARHLAEEPEWLAPAFRWALVHDELVTAAKEAGGDVGRHHRSAEWEATYGRTIPGEDVHEQLEHVHSWLAADLSDAAQVNVVAFGDQPTPALVRVVGVDAEDPDWSRRLVDALDSFIDCQWPRQYLDRRSLG